jgi:hypothetical protein
VGQGKAGAGGRTVGIRNRVLSHLAAVGEITDPGGMASAALARAVGYPGSSVAFAQLLSAMERSGLIERDIRGKRTYRIAAAPGPAAPPDDDRRAAAVAAAGGGKDLDYDELARRLLAQALRGAAAPPPGGHPVFPAAAPDPRPAGAAHRGRDGALDRAVARLERTLADVRARQRRLAEENARLREQIRAARQSLAAMRERAGRDRAGEPGGPAAALLIERLLAPRRETAGPHRHVNSR